MSEQTPPKGDVKTPPPADSETKKDPPKDHFTRNDWNINIIDGDKVQMEKAEFEKIIGTLNRTVSSHDEFVKKSLGKEKTRLVDDLVKGVVDPEKKKQLEAYFEAKSNQELELLVESREILGGDVANIDTSKLQSKLPTTPPPSSHNQSDQTLATKDHSPLGLKNKEENIYNCKCGKSHKLDDFY